MISQFWKHRILRPGARLAIGLVLPGLALAGCRTDGEVREVEEQPEVLEMRAELQEIRTLYAAPDCYSAEFSITSRQPGQSAQTARGVIRADNQNERLLMVFRDPYIGLTLSRVVIREDTVYVTPSGENTQSIPLPYFRVQGMGYNDIALPFSVFQDLLYARLPDEIFARESELSQDEAERAIRVRFQRDGDDYLYTFRERRLDEIRYTMRERPFLVDVDLSGQYGDTAFPQRISMASAYQGRAPSTLAVTFLSINPAANCRESQFSPR